jgi:hypothetical protein
LGKRSDFERKPRDFYPTPMEAVEPLLPHLPKTFDFAEPCAGNGVLIDHLELNGGICMWASDIEPQNKSIHKNDYLEIGENEMFESEYIITNPPWDRKILHPMIEHFAKQKPTWLLFDADWMHTKQSQPYMPFLHKIVSVGRIKWFGNMTGKDNCAWYLFDKQTPPVFGTFFYGRTTK